ncbi:MAG: 30S ribosomal protein THX [Aureispira sp.]|nr:30S ribosomal protein THX [Aureispira sp.]
MGKGDKRSKRGKINSSSYGKARKNAKEMRKIAKNKKKEA